ncbi:MAG: succinate dehydrogenase [Acidimicrobiaceae bacterium]|nr:succinate dehydrogenase [Acidimicrobiaceae bacterium]
MGAPATSPPGSTPIFQRKWQLPFPLNIYQSSIGRKWVMALTGIGLLGFVVVHMIGNLHIYEGPVQLHEYAESLRSLGGGLMPRTFLLWVLRLGLAGMFVLHIHSAYSLKERSRKASDKADFIGGEKKYNSKRDYVAANYASRTMRWTGPIILLYLLFHLADLTWGWWLGDNYVLGDPYHNVVASLSNLPVAIIYVVANVALVIHIFHGTWSLFQSLGINNPKYNELRRTLAKLVAGVILVGNLSFPVLVQTGLIDDDNRTCDVGDVTCLEHQAEKH